MPIFEYKCTDCEEVFEIIQLPGRETEPKCTTCGGTNLKKLISAPFLPSSVGAPANADYIYEKYTKAKQADKDSGAASPCGEDW